MTLAGSGWMVVGVTLPPEGPWPVTTIALSAVCSYAGPVSAHDSGIDTGVLIPVITDLSVHCGRPSGAQSGLPSKRPAVLSRNIKPLVRSLFSMARSPAPNTPCTYAILVPSGDQVQL